MAEIPNPTTQNQGKKRGQNAARGTPPTQRKQNATKRKKPEKQNRQNSLGKRLRERVEQIGVDVQHDRVQHERKNRRTQKEQKTEKLIACRRSSLLKPVALKETVMVTAHPLGDPKTPNHTKLQTGTGT